MATKVNYTTEMVEKAVEMYETQHPEIGNAVLEDIADAIGRSVRSVRAKLVREGVYVAEEKPVKEKVDHGPTKAELLATLAELEPTIDQDGLSGATKPAIEILIAAFEARDAVEAE